MRVPLRISVVIPMLLALAGLASGAVVVAVDLRHVVRDAVDAATARATLMSEFASGEIEAAFRHGDPQRAKTILGRLTSDPLLIAAVLADAADSVRYSSLVALDGKLLPETPFAALSAVVDSVHQARSLRTLVEPGANDLFTLHPVLLRQGLQGPIPDHLGTLILQHDLRPVRREALLQAYQHATVVTLPILLFALLTGVAFHFLFSRRARRLLSQTADIGQGNLDAARVLPGSDEVAELSVSINRMAKELQRRSRTQTLMVAELDHRVKNTLAAVLALLDQTSYQAATLEAFLPIFSGRVRSMARTHEALAASKWAGLDLETLLRLTAVRSLPSERVHLDGERVTLSPRVASPLGLVLHELATNAMKYGAFARPSGTLSLRWTRNGGPGHSSLLDLDWEEDGSADEAMAALQLREGLGLTLVRGLIEHEIGGKVIFERSAGGFRCRVTLHLEPEEKPLAS